MSTNTKEVTEDYTLVSATVILALFKELSTKEFATAMALMMFISYNDGILRYDGKIATGKMISDVLEEKYDSLRKTLSSLTKKRLSKKSKYHQKHVKPKRENVLLLIRTYIVKERM